MFADVAESSHHKTLYCLMYRNHTVCILFITHYAYGSLEDEEEGEEEQKAASQTAGSQDPDGDSVML